MKKAPILSRMLAVIFDSLVVGSLCLIALIPTIVSFVYVSSDSSTLNLVALTISAVAGGGVTLAFIIIYSIILPVLWDGQTLGKKIFNLHTKKTNGESVDFKAMFVRVIFRVFIVFATFGFSLIVDFICLCFSKEHITFYDVIASTRVQ